MKRLALAVLLTLASLIAPAAAGAEAQTTTIRFTAPTPIEYGPGCAGEIVNFDGEISFLLHQTYDANGGDHTISLTRLTGTGTGESGATYRFRQTLFEQYNFPESQGTSPQDPLFEATTVQQTRFLAQGAIDNTLVELVVHVTFNANGEPTATVEQFNFRCTG